MLLNTTTTRSAAPPVTVRVIGALAARAAVRRGVAWRGVTQTSQLSHTAALPCPRSLPAACSSASQATAAGGCLCFTWKTLVFFRNNHAALEVAERKHHPFRFLLCRRTWSPDPHRATIPIVVVTTIATLLFLYEQICSLSTKFLPT